MPNFRRLTIARFSVAIFILFLCRFPYCATFLFSAFFECSSVYFGFARIALWLAILRVSARLRFGIMVL